MPLSRISATLPSATLLIGGEARAGVDYLPLDAQTATNGRQYQEIVLQPTLDTLPDPWQTLRDLQPLVSPDGIITIHCGGGARPSLPMAIVTNLLHLAGFVQLGSKAASGRMRFRARPISRRADALTCTVVVPCRNEVDNVDALIARMPAIGAHTELIWVDGDSNDGTQARIERAIRDHPERDMRLLHQPVGGGKAAAVFQGFDVAHGDVLIILDADMTVAPEDLPRFYLALAEGVCDFANGTRFAYPMQAGAMRPLNYLGNRAFGAVFSRLLGATITDSLCGTKALFRRDWPAIRAARPLFGNHDPWGDFDLLLGAAYSNLRLLDVPVRYYARTAGESKMRPLRHGTALAGTFAAGLRRLGPRRLSARR